MKKNILSRYERSAGGEVVIDVSVRSVEDLFSCFDRAAAYRKKDLDQDFADYLVECVQEIKNAPFVVRISLKKAEEPDRMARTRRSIKNYFKYLTDAGYRDIKKLFKKSALYFCLGATLVFLSFQMPVDSLGGPRVLKNIAAEGLTIAAWVSMWQAFAQLIFELPPRFHRIRIFRKIIKANVFFHWKRSAENNGPA